MKTSFVTVTVLLHMCLKIEMQGLFSDIPIFLQVGISPLMFFQWISSYRECHSLGYVLQRTYTPWSAEEQGFFKAGQS